MEYYSLLVQLLALADWGVASCSHYQVADGSGTRGYRAPEQYMRRVQGDYTDTFALGVTLADAV